MDGHFVAEIAKLKGCVKPFVDANNFDLFGGSFCQGSALRPKSYLQLLNLMLSCRSHQSFLPLSEGFAN